MRADSLGWLCVFFFRPGSFFEVALLVVFVFPGDLRKGIQCCKAMINGLIAGVTLADADRVIWIDLVANESLGSKVGPQLGEEPGKEYT